MRRVGVIGARLHGRRDLVEALVRSLPADTVLVSGGAVDVDTWAEDAAKLRGLERDIRHPDYRQHGSKDAPLIRDREIATTVDELHAFPWWGARGTYFTMRVARQAGVAVVEHKPETLLEVWTSHIGRPDHDALDITRATAWRAEKANAGWKHIDPTRLLRETYVEARELERAPMTLPEAAAATRAAGKPSLGEPWAPSAGLLHHGIEARKRARGESEALAAWQEYEAAFLLELRKSLTAKPLAWGWLLARPRVVLTCVCKDGEHCHRRPTALALAKMGATYRGELT